MLSHTLLVVSSIVKDETQIAIQVLANEIIRHFASWPSAPWWQCLFAHLTSWWENIAWTEHGHEAAECLLEKVIEPIT